MEFDEIELALRRQPSIRDAIVLLREDTPGRKRLVAYITGSSDGVMAALREALPEWSVPSALIVLPELPLNANGKVDRAKLPAPSSGPILAPANRAEQALADIWRRVLGVPEVSRDANFFDLGGTSLQLIEVHAEIQRGLAPTLNLMDLFRDPSIDTLAARISQVTPIRSPNDNRPFIPTTAAAQRASLGADAIRRIREARGR